MLTSDTTIRPSLQAEGQHRENGPEQHSSQAGSGLTSQHRAKALTSEKSGIVTSSRSRGRPLLLAALRRKLATEPQLSYSGHQGAKHNRETEGSQQENQPPNFNILACKGRKRYVFIGSSSTVSTKTSFINTWIINQLMRGKEKALCSIPVTCKSTFKLRLIANISYQQMSSSSSKTQKTGSVALNNNDTQPFPKVFQPQNMTGSSGNT